MYAPLSVPPPGLSKPATPRLSPGLWNDGNLVRWVGGFPTPVKGWERVGRPAFDSDIRAIHKWNDLTGMQFTAYLCDGNLYAVSAAGAWYNISPTVPIEPPIDDFTAGGYGTFTYDTGTFGSPRPPLPRSLAIGPCFTLSNYGSQLLAMSSVDGRLLMWDPAKPTEKAVAVANAPKGRCFVVTPERFVIIFGADGQANRFRWCDQENITNWNMADVASKAGEFDVDPSSPIISATQIASGTLFSTAIGWYLVRFIGLPYVYAYDPVFEGASPLTAAAVVSYGDGAAWLSDSGFFTFNGVDVSSSVCDLQDWFNKSVNLNSVRFRCIGTRLDATNEIWWSFPSDGSRENDATLIWSFSEGWWTKACIGRTAGENSSYTANPEMANKRIVYKHESGVFYSDAAELPWIETGVINARGGAAMSMLRRLLLDLGDDASPVTVSVYCRDFNNTKGQHSREGLAPDEKGVVRCRLSGRDFRIRIGSAAQGSSRWTFGAPMADFAPRGNRSGKI